MSSGAAKYADELDEELRAWQKTPAGLVDSIQKLVKMAEALEALRAAIGGYNQAYGVDRDLLERMKRFTEADIPTK